MTRKFDARVAIAACLTFLPTFAFGETLPWGESSDLVAWEVFAQAMAPAGAPGSAQREFETWASDDDLYVKSPPEWPKIGAARRPPPCKQTFDREMAKAADFPTDACIMEDINRNWAAFRYIVSNELYSKEGLAKAFQQGLTVSLPEDSVQVKADWVKIGDLMRWLDLEEADVRKTYYVRTEQDGEATVDYALLGLHLNAKRTKNWVWATFEHRANPGRCDEMGCHDAFGAVTADVRAKTPANQTYGDCPKTPALLALFDNAGLDPIWRNYCLKGSQLAFTKKGGRPKLLGNSLVDRINGRIPMSRASCVTCHALASFNKAGEPNGAFADNAIGEVDKARLQDYLRNGFVWGIMVLKK